MDRPIRRSDQLIVLAEDDSTIRLADGPPQIAGDAIAVRQPWPAPAERVLLLGWNQRAGKVVEQLDQYVTAGSHLHIAASGSVDGLGLYELQARVRRLRITFKEAAITDRVALESLNIGTFNHVILLADETVDSELADSRTLVTLLHLRDLEATLGERYSIVSEMKDERNRRLAQMAKPDDFVVGGHLISLLLTQLAENHHLATVFGHLFRAEGSEIYLKPADSYVRLGEWINFATVIEAASVRGETAIGYRLDAGSHEAPSFGVRLNPSKHSPLLLDRGDRIIVLADD